VTPPYSENGWITSGWHITRETHGQSPSLGGNHLGIHTNRACKKSDKYRSNEMMAGKVRPATYHGGAMLLMRGILAPVLCLCLAQYLRADDWAGAVTREVFSANRSYFVRISPGESLGETVGFAGAKVGKHAVAEFFHVQTDRGYRLEREIELLNPITPVDFFVSNMAASYRSTAPMENW
jgi:hypothetical protein